MTPMHRNQSVNLHDFTMVPRRDIPRSAIRMQAGYKTTLDAGYLVPFLCEDVLPGDEWNCRVTAFIRAATPIFTPMDNLHVETFFFFTPYRILWTNFPKMFGEQDNPGDSISFTIPQMTSPASGYPINSLGDYFGLGTVGQITAAATFSHSALPFRAYAEIYNKWFRNENITNSLTIDKGDGPDTTTNTALKRRTKRKDYFVQSLPWPQKGAAVTVAFGGTAPVINTTPGGANNAVLMRRASDGLALSGMTGLTTSAGPAGQLLLNSGGAGTPTYIDPNGSMVADLSASTALTIAALRMAEQIQVVLERDARGGTRYVEQNLSHFGVRSPDARLQRPEYIGGGSAPIITTPIAQTSQTGLTGGSTPMGNIAGVTTGGFKGHGFRYSVVEHGCIIGIINVRADITYQQGMRRQWSKKTRYDFYVPAFAQLGEQAVLMKEIFIKGGTPANNDDVVFGYVPRWDEHRFIPSMITGLFRSTASGTIDPWHYAQNFGSQPTLNNTFIEETPPIDRSLAVGAGANGKQFYLDAFIDAVAVRPMPMHGIPSLSTRF